MANDYLVKIRDIIVALFLYPVSISIALILQIFQLIFGQKNRKNIRDEIAVVTGGANGLGREIAIALAQKGCHIAIVDINLENAEKTAVEIHEKYDVKTKAYKVDISDYEQVIELSKNVSADLGPTTILVNNAGMLTFSNMVDPDWREVQNMINVNLTAHFWTLRAFLPQMKKLRKGHIVAISSGSGLIPLIFNAEYSATKFGIRGLMRVLRQDLKATGFAEIQATTIFPFFLNTNTRTKQIVEKVGLERLYPLVGGEEAAQTIVDGILLNKSEITLPSFLAVLYRLFETFPANWQDEIAIAPVKLSPKKFELFRNLRETLSNAKDN